MLADVRSVLGVMQHHSTSRVQGRSRVEQRVVRCRALAAIAAPLGSTQVACSADLSEVLTGSTSLSPTTWLSAGFT